MPSPNTLASPAPRPLLLSSISMQIDCHTLWGTFLWITGTRDLMVIFHSNPFISPLEMTESLTATPGYDVKMKQEQLAGEAKDV